MPKKTKNSYYAWLFLLLLTLVTGVTGCKNKGRTKQHPVAKVYDKYLYLSDIKHIFHDRMTRDDSIAMAHSYINTWVKNRLLLNKAELNLSPEQLDVSQQLDAYRTSLLIYKYETQMVKQKLDTVVSMDEMKAYYKKNSPSFNLNDYIVKALYLKIPKSAPNIDKVQEWYKSNQQEDYKKLESYCYNYATKYDYFKDDWVRFNLIQQELPEHVDVSDAFFKQHKTVEQQDSSFYYFVYFKDFMDKGMLAPFDYIRPEVKDIILNKRKIKFISNLETRIYNDAQDRNHFVIYSNENK